MREKGHKFFVNKHLKYLSIAFIMAGGAGTLSSHTFHSFSGLQKSMISDLATHLAKKVPRTVV